MDIDIESQYKHDSSKQNLEEHNLKVMPHIVNLSEQIVILEAVNYLFSDHSKRHVSML